MQVPDIARLKESQKADLANLFNTAKKRTEKKEAKGAKKVGAGEKRSQGC
jgi:hypothetical protein